MSVELAAGIAFQAVAPLILVQRHRMGVVRRPSFWFTCMVFLFDGLAELLRMAGGGAIPTRVGGVSGAVGAWNLTVGVTSVLFAFAAVVVAGRASSYSVREKDRAAVLRALDWRLATVLTLPLIVLAGSGGYAYSYQADAVTAARASSGIVGQFIVLAVTLTGVCFIAAHPRGFLPVYLIQLAAIVLVGQRLDVIAVGVGTIAGLALLGSRPRWLPLLVAVGVLTVLSLAVNSARSHYGREAYQQATSIPARLTLIARGGIALVSGTPGAYSNATEPLAQRLDGNTYPSAVMQALRHGYRPVGLTTLAHDFQLAVPSFIDPAKLSTDPAARAEKLYQNGHFSLGYTVDFIPTQLGAAVGYFGPVWLCFLGGLLGAAFGVVERWGLRRITPARFLTLLGLVLCALSYEKSNEVYPLTARGVLVVWMLFTVVSLVRGRVRTTRRTPPRTRSPHSPRSLSRGQLASRSPAGTR